MQKENEDLGQSFYKSQNLGKKEENQNDQKKYLFE